MRNLSVPGCRSLESVCHSPISSFLNVSESAREYLNIGTNLHLAQFLKEDDSFNRRYFLTLGTGMVMLLVLILVYIFSSPRLSGRIQHSLHAMLRGESEDQPEHVPGRED